MSLTEPDNDDCDIFADDTARLEEREAVSAALEAALHSDGSEALRALPFKDVPILWTTARKFLNSWEPRNFCFAFHRANWKSSDLHQLYQEQILWIACKLRGNVRCFETVERKLEAICGLYKWVTVLYNLVPDVLEDTVVLNEIFQPGTAPSRVNGYSELDKSRSEKLKEQWHAAKTAPFNFYEFLPGN